MTSKNTDGFRITVSNEQSRGTQTETISETAVGTYRIKNGTAYIAYRSGGSLNMLKSEPGLLTLTKRGEYRTELRCRAGETFAASYETPFGTIEMTLDTRFVTRGLTEDGGRIRLGCTLDINGDKLHNNITITIERER